ncbi:MAG: hypothetical protein WBP45_07420, partial [Daejeonella sp.]
MINELQNLELDLLFRIDFNALANYSGEKHFDKNFIKLNTQQYIDKYKFKKYYSREHQYVKLSDLSEELTPYLN